MSKENKTPQEVIEFYREVLTVKSDFLAIGIDKFPAFYVGKLAPKDNVIAWGNSVRNTWNLRTASNKHLEVLKNALELAKNE